MRGTALGVAVPRGPGPAGLGRERDDPLDVGVEPEVAGGAADQPAGDDRVVGEEDVEAGGGADAPLRRVHQAAERHRLDPGDAGVVHPGDGDRLDPGAPQPVDGGLRALAALGPVRPRRQHGAGDGGPGRAGGGPRGGPGGGLGSVRGNGSSGHAPMLPGAAGARNSPIGWSERTSVHLPHPHG